ncbi:hypothetical protein [Phenylobacterium sp.]|uniref:hypothetical protein n=1 Tax=Phenylobacterium sp. TaxID=1871053 RepID=UPI003983CE5D
MQPIRRRGRTAAVALSAAAHAAVLAVLAAHTPLLRLSPETDPGPPEAIIPLLILPRTPPPPGTAGPPTPVRLHRRPPRAPTEELPVAPLIAPLATPSPAPAVTGPVTVAAPPDPMAQNASAALRGKLGCMSAGLLGLTRAQLEACEDELAKGVRQAEFPGLGLDADKNSALARAAARKEADYKYMRAPVPPGFTTAGPGQSAESLGQSLGNDRPALTVPF